MTSNADVSGAANIEPFSEGVVSERALLGRLNRRLRGGRLEVKKLNPRSRAYRNLGGFYLRDFHRNFILQTHCDLEALGRERNALASWERLLVAAADK